jgi:hypothetical protein
MGHHAFSRADWPFRDPPNAWAAASPQIVSSNSPILLVVHDGMTGQWQFYADPTDKRETCHTVCLGCIFEQDPSIAEVATLPANWKAWRKSTSSDWQSQPF